jgi:hypothetical protein
MIDRLGHGSPPAALILLAFCVAACASGTSSPPAPWSPQSASVLRGASPTTACATTACIYIANWAGGASGFGTLTVYARGANGDVAPIQTVSGSSTRLNGPWGIALDTSRNIYVANTGGRSPSGFTSVTVYAAGANGNVAPIQTISGSNTGLSQASGIAVDASRNIYVGNVGNAVGSVTVYAAGATGNIAPIRTVAGSRTGLTAPYFIAVTGSGVIYAANPNGGRGGVGSVTSYAPGANGDVAPIRTISGSNTGLHNPTGIALGDHGTTFVSNVLAGPSGIGSVTVYTARAHGNVAPLRTISGSNTMLDNPFGIAVDSSDNIYVVQPGVRSGPYSMTVYAGGANGNVAPLRTITGPSTGLVSPAGVTVR